MPAFFPRQILIFRDPADVDVARLRRGCRARIPWCFDELEEALRRKAAGLITIWLFRVD
jgi:hypothetical protein